MGFMEHGAWREGRRPASGGAFVRKDSVFRRAVTADGSSGFPAEPSRYHLFVSLACPWASRTVIVRALKRLEDVVGMTVVDPDMLEQGWTFGGHTEALTGARHLHEIYRIADPDYSGSVTVPVLWDTRTRTIVNNESSEIIRMLNRAFDACGADAGVDLYPEEFAVEIDAVNAWIYPSVNNGVYRAGFAMSQEAYGAAVRDLFGVLDALEERLGERRYLVGDRLTEADVRLFTTIVRFDLVYYGHFKCNVRQIRDYPNLSGWVRDVYQTDGIAPTVDLAQIKRHYYHSQRWVNPTGIVPAGPHVDFSGPHDRARLGA